MVEETEEYVRKLMRISLNGLRSAGLEHAAERMEALLKEIEEGKRKPDIFILEPGHVIKWTEISTSTTTIGRDSISHKGDYNELISARLHLGGGFHLLGRLRGDLRVGYIAFDEKGKPTYTVGSVEQRTPFKVINIGDLTVSRIHGILAPHPTEKGKFIYIHLGKNKPVISRPERA